MSEQNVESAKRGTEAFNRLDFDAYADTCAADYEWYSLLAGSAARRTVVGYRASLGGRQRVSARDGVSLPNARQPRIEAGPAKRRRDAACRLAVGTSHK